MGRKHNTHYILVGIKGYEYETRNYETSPWHFYAGSPVAVTVGQQYTVGEKDTTFLVVTSIDVL